MDINNMQDRKTVFDSVKNNLEHILNKAQDVDFDTLTKSFITTFFEEAGLYSVIGTIPIIINDGNKNFSLFIDIRQNETVFIVGIDEEICNQ